VIEILQNIEHDIATVEGYLKRLRASKRYNTQAGFAIAVYEDILDTLMDQRRQVKEYIEEADK
jgi:hypothetical protein